ncbi:hypothetical protein OOP60_005421 [Salmonella enterica]|nr:hypothetical protein [Salmonella enterica]EKB5476958.1 hypothetical protein [Salmonella enterica]
MDVQDGDSFNYGVNIMSKTPNPTITITVSGPTGSGKSRVLAVIADVLRLIHSDCIIEAPDVKAEKEMCGDDYTAWHKPRSGTIFKLNEINQPINTGRCSTDDVETVIKKLATARENLVKAEVEIRNKMQAAITSTDLCDRLVPAHIQALMSKLGISFEEYQETDLQPVVDLVNWALTTPPVPEQTIQPDKKDNEPSRRNPNCLSGVVSKDHDDRARRNTAFSQAIGLVDQQLKGKIDPVTARASWYGFMNEHGHTDLADYLGNIFNGAVKRIRRIPSLQNINTNGLPVASSEQEELAEKISGIYSCVMSQLHGMRDTTRACKFWRKTLEEQVSKELLAEIIVRSIGDMHDYIEENKPVI